MTGTTYQSNAAVERFNRLLRGELSAIETYKQAREKISPMNGGQSLRELQDDHIAAANAIATHIRDMGGTPAKDSGAWGTFATAVEGTAKVFGNTAALKALKEGEEHGINEYRRALDDEGLGPTCRELISRQLLPQTEKHVAQIDRLMAMQV